VIPDFSSFGVAVNFTHRLGAVIVSIFVITTAFSIFKHYSSVPRLRRPAMLSLALLALQITLGGIVILYKMPVTPTTLHVSTGAGILGTMFYIAMQSNHVLARRSPSGAVTLREEPTPRIVVSEA
jgi:heme A synthase